MRSDKSSAGATLERIVAATNAHDLEALVGCFASDYRNETPVHPGRGFVGAEQVRRNWTQIFAAVPDVRVEVRASCVEGDVVWSEWEMAGTRRDGVPHLMRGVIIFGTREGRADWARFYLEPAEADGGTIDDAVRVHTTAKPGAS